MFSECSVRLKNVCVERRKQPPLVRTLVTIEHANNRGKVELRFFNYNEGNLHICLVVKTHRSACPVRAFKAVSQEADQRVLCSEKQKSKEKPKQVNQVSLKWTIAQAENRCQFAHRLSCEILQATCTQAYSTEPRGGQDPPAPVEL